MRFKLTSPQGFGKLGLGVTNFDPTYPRDEITLLLDATITSLLGFVFSVS
jgi:hypothetical protein